MSIVIFGYQSIEDTPYHEWIPEVMDKVILLCNSEIADSYPDHLYNKIIIENYNYNVNLEKIVIDLHKNNNIETIIALDEFDIERAGRLRSYLGIHGQDSHSALLYRDKYLMKTKLHNEAISVTPFRELRSVIDLIDFIFKNDYPVVVKPKSLAGSLGVRILTNEKELSDLLTNGIPDNCMVEKYVEGTMYHIDGLITKHEVSFLYPSVYKSTCLDWSLGGYTASYLLSRKNTLFNDLKDFVQKAIEALSLPEHSPFHAEVFVTRDGQLLFNEVGSRVPGGRSNYEIYHGTNINFNRVTVRHQCGLKEEFSFNQSFLTGHIYIPPIDGILVDIPDIVPNDKVIEYLPNKKLVGKDHSDAKSSVDCVATVICKGESEEEISRNIEEIYNYIIQNTKWIPSKETSNY